MDRELNHKNTRIQVTDRMFERDLRDGGRGDGGWCEMTSVST